MRVEAFALRNRGETTASEKKSEQPGGRGVLRELRFLEARDVSILSYRRGVNAPAGLAGGSNGAPGRNTWFKAGGTVDGEGKNVNPVELPGSAQFRVEPGDRLRIETPGGGAYGKTP